MFTGICRLSPIQRGTIFILLASTNSYAGYIQPSTDIENVHESNKESIPHFESDNNISLLHKTNSRRRRISWLGPDDDDWKYQPTRRQLLEAKNDDNINEGNDDNNNAGKDNNNDCITEYDYLCQLINHMLSTSINEWSINEIVLGCCVVSLVFSAVLVALCCVYGCCSAYCCCCCEERRDRRRKNAFGDDDTYFSGYGLDYQFTNDSS
jgi:hypothetical protein